MKQFNIKIVVLLSTARNILHKNVFELLKKRNWNNNNNNNGPREE
jgi:hypothetical protein